MKYLILILCIFSINTTKAQDLLLEAESFDDKGGWVVDPQFIEQMGSSYVLAHGMGIPVVNAKTQVNFKKQGEYKVWVRTKNWVPGEWEAPGKFQIKVRRKQKLNLHIKF